MESPICVPRSVVGSAMAELGVCYDGEIGGHVTQRRDAVREGVEADAELVRHGLLGDPGRDQLGRGRPQRVDAKLRGGDERQVKFEPSRPEARLLIFAE